MYSIDSCYQDGNYYFEFNKYNKFKDKDSTIIMESDKDIYNALIIDNISGNVSKNIPILNNNINYYQILSTLFTAAVINYSYSATVQKDKDGYYVPLPLSKYQIYVDKKFMCFGYMRHLVVMNGANYIDKFFTLDNGNIVNIHYEFNRIDSITLMKKDPVIMSNINKIKSKIPNLSFQPRSMIMNDNNYTMVYDKYGIMKSCKINGNEYCQYDSNKLGITSYHPLVFDNFFMENLGTEIMICDEYEKDKRYVHFTRNIIK